MARWDSSFELVDLSLGKIIYEPGRSMDYVYFPTTAVVSLLQLMRNGSTGEIAVVGNDGLVGIALFMGGDSTPSQAVVQSAGQAYRLPARAMKVEFDSGGAVLHLFLRYTQALIAQMAQTAVCNRHHTLHQQLSRWLLISLDRLPANQLVMTQQLIANMLGVRREGVNEEAARLQAEGAIKYSRGKITVVDRSKLEEFVCECYSVVNDEYTRLLPRFRTKQ